jgi:GTP cyclohydrolase I
LGIKNQKKMRVVVEKSKDLEKETRRRLRNLKKEFSKEPILRLFQNEKGYDQIIAQIGIPFVALCEHHWVSFEGEVSIGYIPGKYLIGLSKLGRIVEYYLNPTVKTTQEKATHQIMETLKKIKPKGAMVVIKAKHGCICYRGVKKPSWTVTSAVYGSFRKNLSTRQEFLSLLKL